VFPQILRIQTLELLHKFTTNEAIKQHLSSLVPLLLELIRNDNEDMGLLALKMFGELLRAFRTLVEPHVPKYFQLLQELYSSTVAYVEELFSPTGAAMVEPDRSTFAKAFPSLKLLSEASLQCLFIYQFANNVPSLQALLPPCQVMLDPIVKVRSSSLKLLFA
jgi:transformation/transcription domain-associated protein